MAQLPYRNAWDDPNVKAAIQDGRPFQDIALIQCLRCGSYGYWNEGSHFSCSVDGCNWSCSGKYLDNLLEAGEVTNLNDCMDMMDEVEEVP